MWLVIQRTLLSEVLQQLIRKTGNPQLIVSAYLTQIKQWPKLRIGDPNHFISIAFFFRCMAQTFQLHHFQSDIEATPVVKSPGDKLKPPMLIRWSQHFKNTKIEQPNLEDFEN